MRLGDALTSIIIIVIVSYISRLPVYLCLSILLFYRGAGDRRVAHSPSLSPAVPAGSTPGRGTVVLDTGYHLYGVDEMRSN